MATTPTLASRPATPSTGAATPIAPGWISPVVATAWGSAGERPARIARPAAPRLHDGQRQRLRTVDHREVCRRADGLRELPQDRHGSLPEVPVHAAGDREDGQTHLEGARGVPLQVAPALQGRHETVDHRPR